MKLKITLFLIINTLITGCGNYVEFKEDPGFLGRGEQVAIGFDTVFKEVLDARCTKCHGNYDQYDKVFEDRDAIARTVTDGSMPKDGPMSQERRRLILGWIASGAPRGVTSGGDNQEPLPLAPNFENIKENIFAAKCIGCHSPSGQASFYDFTEYESIVAMSNPAGDQVIDLENPLESRFVYAITDEMFPMPPLDSPFDQLTVEEVEVLKEWIIKGIPEK